MRATCDWCQQEMKAGVGCTLATYDDFADGVPTKRIPYGSETRFSPDHSWPPTGDRTCHDCNVGVGQLHHPGCDMEECPRCGIQAISCYCENMPPEAQGRMVALEAQRDRLAQTILIYRCIVDNLVAEIRQDTPDADELIADAERNLTDEDRERVG